MEKSRGKKTVVNMIKHENITFKQFFQYILDGILFSYLFNFRLVTYCRIRPITLHNESAYASPLIHNMLSY